MNFRLNRPAFSLLAAACVSMPLFSTGCANFVETRTITAFTEALEECNLAQLKDSTSSRFDRKALRLEESIEDFAILRLPKKDDIEITEVDDISETEKRVTVQSGRSTRKLRYRLIKDSKSNKWVVDDVFVTRKQDGVVASKPVTELLDLVSTVREFLKAWDSGDRARMQAVTDEELGDILSALPRDFVAHLAERTIGDRASDSKIRPEASMDDNVAVVRLPRKSGQMVISFEKTGEQWRITDLAVESRKDRDHIPSVKQYATVLASASKFLDSYAAADKIALRTVTQKSFFESSLEPARLSTVTLPSAEQAARDCTVTLKAGFATLVIPRPNDLVKLSLGRLDGEDIGEATRYLVEDVTIYELDSNEEKRLSALFLSHAMVELFAESLSLRELSSVRLMSTHDFAGKVWDILDEATLMKLPMSEIKNEVPRVLTTVFLGPVTEVTVEQGANTVLVYVLRDQEGELLVDDVLLPVEGRPASLKATLQVMIPVLRFAEAMDLRDYDLLQRRSSRDLNSAVWHMTNEIPSLGVDPVRYFRLPLTTLEVERDRAVAGLGDERFGAKVLLVREDERFVVDDVRLISGVEMSQRVDMKEGMRREMSRFRGPTPIVRPAPSQIPVQSPSQIPMQSSILARP
jgi:hypothetical protein